MEQNNSSAGGQKENYATANFQPGANNMGQNTGRNSYFTPQYILPPEMQAKKDLKTATTSVGLLLIMFTALQLAVPTFYSLICGLFGNRVPSSGSVEYQLFYVIFYFITFFFPTLMYIVIKKVRGEKLFSIFSSKPKTDEHKIELKASRLRDYICLSFFTLATTYAGMYISNYIEAFVNSFGFGTNMELFIVEYDNLTAKLINAFVVCIMAPIFEELLFRGAILHSLRRFGDTFAIVCSAIVFGIMHGNIQQLPHALIGGLIFGYIVVKRGNLISSIILHFVNNVSVTILDFALDQEYFRQNEVLSLAIQYILIAITMLVSIFLLWYYLKKEPYRLDADIETSAGKKADAFLPGLTSYKIFFSNVFVILFIIYSFINVCFTLAPISLTEMVA